MERSTSISLTYSEVIGRMICDERTFHDFLKATPIDLFCFSKHKKVFENEYFTHLYTESSVANGIVDKIQKEIRDLNTQTFLITGYKGCGKTTFATFLSKCLESRSKILTFDESIDTTLLIKKVLVMYVYNRITDDIQSGFEVSSKLLDIFCSDENIAFFDNFFDARDAFIDFFDSLDALRECKRHEIENKKKELKNFCQTSLAINELLTLMVLWDISYRLLKNETPKCVFIFDNLDVLIEYTPLIELFREYSAFCKNCSFLFDNLSYIGLTKPGYNPFQDYIFIFVMRETTKATIVEHFNDRYPNSQNYVSFEISDVIDKTNILKKRLKYITNNPYVSTTIKKQAEMLSTLLEDRYFKNNYFNIFNNDYRTSIDVLCEIVGSDAHLCSNYIQAKRKYPRNTQVGATGILIRSLCNLFIDQQYFTKFIMCEYTKEKNKLTNSINISRLILTYLKNRCTEYSLKGVKKEDNSISLIEIFDKFDGICDLSYVIDAIWFMFNLRNEPYWNHLITFDIIKKLEQDELSQQLVNYKSKNRINASYSSLRITPAGRFFLDEILVHFEYFSCRLTTPNTLALFNSKNSIKTENGYVFQNTIGETINLVKECSFRISNFYKKVFVNECDYTDKKFLGSHFAFHKLDSDNIVVNHMFHAERMIHSHINYIDVYRRYILSSILNIDEKKNVNKIVINYIIQYMDMFGYYNSNNCVTHFSPQTQTLCAYYDTCIEFISKKNQYEDFETPIDRETGKNLADN